MVALAKDGKMCTKCADATLLWNASSIKQEDKREGGYQNVALRHKRDANDRK
jgi:hypothetical protein